MKRTQKSLAASLGFLGAFVLWTAVLCLVDVQPIGPRASFVGLAGINRLVHSLTGVHMFLYNLTDWLGLLPAGICMGFGILGLSQWVKRKSIRKVDFSILVLGGFYLVTALVYCFFERVVINFRPVLIGGILEASYPSSTTLLTMCVMPTALMQLRARIKARWLRSTVSYAVKAFSVFTVIARLLCGVHWFSDIVGGILLSAGLVMMYHSVCKIKERLL